MMPVPMENGQLPAYAWPGGYPLFYLDKMDAVLCVTCANKEKEGVKLCDINYEDNALYCDECSRRIESGNPEGEYY